MGMQFLFFVVVDKKKVYIFIILVFLLHKLMYRGNKVSMDIIICKRIGDCQILWLPTIHNQNAENTYASKRLDRKT